MNSGYRKSGGRAKITTKINNRSTNSDRHIEEIQIANRNKIEEEDEDDDAGNISESLILPATPPNNI